MKQDYLQLRVLELAPRVFVTGQLFETDLGLAVQQGIRSIVDNRDDGESAGQPASAHLAKAAEALGMAFVRFPVDPVSISADDVVAFRKICAELERPLLLFSRTGRRSIKIWEMAESQD